MIVSQGSSVRDFSGVAAFLDRNDLVDSPLMAAPAEFRRHPSFYDSAEQHFSKLVA